jgi:hypothetical protein
VKRHPSGEYHLWHILPGDGDGPYKNCTPAVKFTSENCTGLA